MSQSATTPATRNELRKTSETSESDHFCSTPQRHGHKPHANGCDQLQTVARRLANMPSTSLNPQTPRVKWELLLRIQEKVGRFKYYHLGIPRLSNHPSFTMISMTAASDKPSPNSSSEKSLLSIRSVIENSHLAYHPRMFYLPSYLPAFRWFGGRWGKCGHIAPSPSVVVFNRPLLYVFTKRSSLFVSFTHYPVYRSTNLHPETHFLTYARTRITNKKRCICMYLHVLHIYMHIRYVYIYI